MRDAILHLYPAESTPAQCGNNAGTWRRSTLAPATASKAAHTGANSIDVGAGGAGAAASSCGFVIKPRRVAGVAGVGAVIGVWVWVWVPLQARDRVCTVHGSVHESRLSAARARGNCHHHSHDGSEWPVRGGAARIA